MMNGKKMDGMKTVGGKKKVKITLALNRMTRTTITPITTEVTEEAEIGRIIMVEIMAMIGGRETETMAKTIGVTMTVTLRRMEMTGEITDSEETEIMIEAIKKVEEEEVVEEVVEEEVGGEVEEMVIMTVVLTETIVITKAEDVKTMMMTIKTVRRKERSTFHLTNLLMRITCLHTTCQWV